MAMDRSNESSARSTRDSAGVRIPPPLIFLAGLAAAVVFDRFVTLWSISGGSGLRFLAAVPLAAAGAAVIVLALALFRRAGTRPEPWQPTSALVFDGIYRVTRNPMYLGMALLYAGVAVALDSPLALLLLAPVVAAIHFGVVAREERYLEAKFGEPYRRYRAQVRPWL